MGAGIVSSNGQPPAVEWRMRLGILAQRSPEIAAEVTGLLAGQPRVAADGALEISWLRLPDELVRVTVRRASASRVADLYLRPFALGDPAAADARDPLPCPERWQTPAAGGAVAWELFNCEVVSIRSRDNTGD